jgi:acetylornithine deacetylase/succinyl-diaminopimelate desuccinylase-like protein
VKNKNWKRPTAMQKTPLSTLKEIYEQSKEKTLKDFLTFLRFQSISSEKEYKKEMHACVHWLQSYLDEMGFTTNLWETSGHPVLFAEHLEAGPEQPTLLIYNHYDVQPLDPLELWETHPFEPAIRGGQVYARGAQDNKGQCFYAIQAIRLLLERDGRLPINIKWIIEGEEETGSEGLSGILQTKTRELKADIAAIVDLGIPSADAPAMTLGTRGIITMDVEASGSSTDLHSGLNGGIVYNPIHALVEILSKCRDADGKVTVPGFYDAVKPLSEEEKSRLFLEFDAEQYREAFGAEATGGEKAFSPLERAWTRPTLEINGICGGYTGSGFKTVIPAKASAKISCRVVPDQDPETIGRLVANHLESLAPEGIKIAVNVHAGSGAACRSDMNSRGVKAFAKAYEEIFAKQIPYTFEGGSIPIINALAKASGSEVVLLGLGLPDDYIHAPNEHFGIDRLEKGALITARGIELLGC